MPGKGRRVASRQAELGRRRRRQSRGTATVAGDGSSGTEESASVATAAQKEPQTSSPVSKPQAPVQANPAQSTPQRNVSRNRLDRPAAYNFIAPELRRILILAGVLLAVLIAISFFI